MARADGSGSCASAHDALATRETLRGYERRRVGAGSALAFARLDQVLLVGALVRDEEPAVGALEAQVPLRGPAHELSLEGLAAVRAHDLEALAVSGRGLGHRGQG